MRTSSRQRRIVGSHLTDRGEEQRMVIEFEKLKQMVQTAFEAVGAAKENAARMADVLVTAEARGVYSHGIQLVSNYLDQIDQRRANPNPEIQVLKETETTLLVDGDAGFGGVSLTAAVELAIRKARTFGTAALTMVNCNHYGAGAYYVEQAAGAGMLGYLYANTPKMAAPFGGAERYLGTNPYSFAAPAGRYGNIVLDMATTETAAGKIMAAIADGVQVRPGFGVDHLGQPTTDPNEIMNGGSMCHFGGVKGYGVSFMIDVVTGVLSGSAYKADDISMFGTGEGKPTVSFFMNLTDISRFMEVSEFEARAADLIDDIKKVRPAKGFTEVCYPGELENRRFAAARTEGVHIHDAAYEDFLRASDKRGVRL